MIDYIWLTEYLHSVLKIYLIRACRDLWAWGKRGTDEEGSTFWKGWRETWSQCPGSLYSSILNWKPVKQSTKADEVTLQPALGSGYWDVVCNKTGQLFSTVFWNIYALGKWSLTQQLTLTLVINPTAVQEHTHTIETRKYKNGVYRSDAALIEKLFYLYKIQNLPARISHPAKRLFWSFQRCYVQCLCCEAWECTHTHSSLKSSLTSDRKIFGMEDVLRPKYAQVCNSCTVLLKHDSFFLRFQNWDCNIMGEVSLG